MAHRPPCAGTGQHEQQHDRQHDPRPARRIPTVVVALVFLDAQFLQQLGLTHRHLRDSAVRNTVKTPAPSRPRAVISHRR
jgi:hypothetical protein